jgi:Tfp pilus assembly protein PilZ
MKGILDKRKTKRSIIRIKVFDSGIDELIGNTIDLNSTGMLLVGPEDFQLGNKISVRLEHTYDPRKNVVVMAEVVWHMPSVKAGMFNSGFYFINATPEQTRFIENLIEELAM